MRTFQISWKSNNPLVSSSEILWVSYCDVIIRFKLFFYQELTEEWKRRLRTLSVGFLCEILMHFRNKGFSNEGALCWDLEEAARLVVAALSGPRWMLTLMLHLRFVLVYHGWENSHSNVVEKSIFWFIGNFIFLVHWDAQSADLGCSSV